MLVWDLKGVGDFCGYVKLRSTGSLCLGYPSDTAIRDGTVNNLLLIMCNSVVTPWYKKCQVIIRDRWSTKSLLVIQLIMHPSSLVIILKVTRNHSSLRLAYVWDPLIFKLLSTPLHTSWYFTHVMPGGVLIQYIQKHTPRPTLTWIRVTLRYGCS